MTAAVLTLIGDFAMSTLSTTDAVEETDRTDIKPRMCLGCQKTFTSVWAGERICPRCKTGSAWRAGVPHSKLGPRQKRAKAEGR